MSEFFLELFSEEMPTVLQKNARENILKLFKDNFEFANTEHLLKNFDIAESECKSLLEKKLPLPAYDQCLKASHIFNLLDARGVIGVAQRTEYISRIRELAKGSGQSWLESQK